MKRILCFGDSNTWGYIPATGSLRRYGEDVRWTALLQKRLGPDYRVIEFGLCGCEASGKNRSSCVNADAQSLFPPVLFASLPVDLIFIMLGTNDLKTVNQWQPGDTARGLKKLLAACHSLSSESKIVLAPAVLLDERIVRDPEFTARAVADSRLCADEVELLAKEEGLPLFDTNDFVEELGEDGCHWSERSHASFARGLGDFLLPLLQEAPEQRP